MRNERDWQRLGSEAQAEDARRGNTAPITDEELRDVLAHHFEVDLADPSICDDDEEALDSLVRGYRVGG